MPAGAPIVYWAGTEDIDFAMIGSATSVAGVTNYDSNFVRISLGTQAPGTATWPIVNGISNPLSFGNRSSFWMHFEVLQTTNLSTLNAIMLAFADAGGVGRILVRGTGTNGQIKISTRNAAGVITDLAGAVSAAGVTSNNTRVKMDVFVNYSAAGQVQVYIGGVNVCDTGAGDYVTTDSASSLSFFYLSSLNTSVQYPYWSQVFVADTDTRAAGLWLMNSSTAGNAQAWTGTASNVNKAAIADATYITSSAAGQIQEYKPSDIPLPTGQFIVAAVVMSSRALIGAGGPQHLEYVVRVGSTDYVGGSWSPVIGTFGNDTQNYKIAVNPATGVAWTTADLTAATFNYGVESVT